MLALFASIVVLPFAFASCNDDETPISSPTPTTNKAECLTDSAKRAMVYSLTDLEGTKGRIYEMTYTVDYKLDEALQFGIDGTTKLRQFVALRLFDKLPTSQLSTLTYDAGCSAFACPDSRSNDYLMGRNFDFNHLAPGTTNREMIPVIAVHTAPAGGKKSVSFVDGKFVDYNQGFYTDKNSDLSMLMALPYLLLDGINEDGFAVSVLKLDGLPTKQEDTDKPTIFTTVAMRMLLDRASTVQEAIGMLEKYNMCMARRRPATISSWQMPRATMPSWNTPTPTRSSIRIRWRHSRATTPCAASPISMYRPPWPTPCTALTTQTTGRYATRT